MTDQPAKSHEPTIAVLLTPPGRAAVASVLVAGPRAVEVVGDLFLPAGNRGPGLEPWGGIRFGRWGGAGGDEVVVAALGPERVEVHGHGGIAAPQAILASLAALGCAVLDWQSWLARSSADPLTAAATVALAAARTERAAAVLVDQYHGALRQACDDLSQALARNDLAQSSTLVAALLERAPLGLHLVEPWKVVLAGPPNVGKSSLINALVGYQRAIVYDTPGTTRDVVTAAAALGGWPVELADTAGLRSSADPLEAAGAELAAAQLRTADAIVLVFDICQSWQQTDQRLIEDWPAAIVVYNKCDLRSVASDGRPPGICCSTIDREGLSRLELAIVERLVPNELPPGAAVPFTRCLVELLQVVQTSIDRQETAQAQRVLRRMTTATADID